MEGERRSINFDDLYSVRLDGLNDDIREAELRDIFGRYGQVEDVYIPTSRPDGRTKGFGFIRYKTEEEARDALKEDGTEIAGVRIRVDYAGKRTPRDRRRRSRDYGRRYRSRSRSYHRHHSRSRDRSRDRSRGYGRDRSRSRSHGYSRRNDRVRERSRSRSGSRDYRRKDSYSRDYNEDRRRSRS